MSDRPGSWSKPLKPVAAVMTSRHLAGVGDAQSALFRAEAGVGVGGDLDVHGKSHAHLRRIIGIGHRLV